MSGPQETPAQPSDVSAQAAEGQPTGTAGNVADKEVADKAAQLLEEAEAALNNLDGEATSSPAQPFALEDLIGHEGPPEKCSIDLLRDVDLDLKIELGRTQMLLEDVLKLRRGSVVTLDKLAGDPVDLFVNGRLVARGEILVLNDNFCVRVVELVGSDDLADEV
jgi:flagellar motor switch protein FliN/FliY